jgi:crotonobetainyl-CoA:carnitine CoA-transferase CaiB-like acyl-CoA transferase
MALFHQQKTGQGQKIEIPMFETMANFVLSDHLYGRAFEPPLAPAGYARLMARDRRPYPTKDGYICSVLYTDSHWRRFLDYVGHSELIQDPRFSSMSARTANIDDVLAFLGETLIARTTAEWLEVFSHLDIPSAPLATLDTLIEDEHLNDVGFFSLIDHPSEGRMRVTGVPEKWSGTPAGFDRECALLGQHTLDVLKELDLSEQEIDALLAAGIVHAAAPDTGEVGASASGQPEGMGL